MSNAYSVLTLALAFCGCSWVAKGVPGRAWHAYVGMPGLQVAKKFKHEPAIFFPHDLDFRGRAYPMHPHLNHMGPDVCRGLLWLAEAKPLGEHGFYWLLVQVSLPLGVKDSGFVFRALIIAQLPETKQRSDYSSALWMCFSTCTKLCHVWTSSAERGSVTAGAARSWLCAW